jgi:hypothetical protein
MGAFRALIGGIVGAAVAGGALRWKRLSDQPGVTYADAAAQLPDALLGDVARLREAASGAVRDGMEAARRQEATIEQVLTPARRTRGDR